MENSFDKAIQDSLKDLSLPYDEGSWDLLEQKIDAAELAQAERIDAAAKQALDGLTVPYNAFSWQQLSDRLDQMDYRRKLIGLKVLEAAVVLLAIFALTRYIGQFPKSAEPVQQHFAAEVPMDEQMEAYTDRLDAHTAVTGTREAATQSSDAQTSAGVTRTGDPMPIRNADAAQAEGATADAVAVAATEQSNAKAPILSILPDASTPLTAYNAARINTRQLHAQVSRVGERSAQLPPRAYPLRATETTLNTIPALKTAELEGWSRDLTVGTALAAVSPKKIQTKIGMYWQDNRHTIFYIDPTFRANRVNKVRNDGIGIMTTVEMGRIGFDFGIGYERVVYSTTLTGPNEVHKAQIPVHLRLMPIKSKHVNVYLKGGASVHGALYANYEEPTSLSAGGPAPARYGEEFNDGLLKGGYSLNNVYWSINTGVGVEARISDKISTFAEVLNQKHQKSSNKNGLKGGLLGQTSDKFETIAVNVGMNYAF